MSSVYSIDDVMGMSPGPDSQHSWTAIIPAAGRGSRLGFHQPKLLYPVLGKPLFEWCLDRLKPYCKRFVLILAPGVDRLVRPRLEELVPGDFSLVLQEKPLGMGHAVQQAQPVVHTPYSIVMWVDQIALSDRTLSACLTLAHAHPAAKLIFPTVHRAQPYIRFERDPEGRIRTVHQAREEDMPITEGENDCGIFFFRSKSLFRALTEAGEAVLLGKKTREMNLLPVIPWLDQEPGDVITLRIRQAEESMGLNTDAEARQLASILEMRSSHGH